MPPPQDPFLGKTLMNRYYIERKLGEGGMGSVYKAVHVTLEKPVALKILHHEFCRKPDLVERFLQEAKAASKIRHENVIDITDFGTTADGSVFFAMEFLNGRDLHDEIARARLSGEVLPWTRTSKIFSQVCAALSAAHQKGIVHRDLKPENIYLVEWLGHQDFVKLLDFGIAKMTEVSEGDRKLTRTGMLFGTPEYMSPEQARGEKVDHRVDVYAMGCILYQLLVGKVPFEADNFMSTLSLHLSQPPPRVPPEVFTQTGAPPGLQHVLDRALAKDRDERFSTIDDLLHAVEVVNQGGAVAAAPAQPAPDVKGPAKTKWEGQFRLDADADSDTPAPPRETPKPKKSKAGLIVGLVAVVVVAAVAGVLATRGGGKKTDDQSDPQANNNTPPTTDDNGTKPDDPPKPNTNTDNPKPKQPTLPAQVTIKFVSVPTGAKVIDVKDDTVLGTTPFSTPMPGSKTPVVVRFEKNRYQPRTVKFYPLADTTVAPPNLERRTTTTHKIKRPTVVIKPKIDPPKQIKKPPPKDDGTTDPKLKNPFMKKK